MEIHLTVRGSPDATSGVTVAVDGPPDTAFGAVRTALLEAAGSSGPVTCGGRTVLDDDVVGRPPLLHGAVLVAGEAAAVLHPAALDLHVRAGPDCGRVHHLTAGTHTVGRLAGGIRLDDPQVSRLHARIRVPETPGAPVTIEDCGATNGLLVNDVLVPAGGVDVRNGDVIRIGQSMLSIEPVSRPGAASSTWRPDGAGGLRVNRPPSPTSPRPVRTFQKPAEPDPPARTRLPIVALAVPLVAGAGLATLTGSAAYLLFILLSPLMLLGTWASDRFGNQRAHRDAVATFQRDLQQHDANVASAFDAERAWLHGTFPDLAALQACARGDRAGLWRRQPGDADFLSLRLGLGSVPSLNGVETPGPAPPALEVLEAPVTVSLTHSGVVGLAGPRDRVAALARAVVAQVCGWHSPRDVSLVVLAPAVLADWEWLRWLPHVGGDTSTTGAVAMSVEQVRRLMDALVDQVDSRTTRLGPAGDRDQPSTVVLALGGETLRGVASSRQLLTRGRDAAVYVICVDESVDQLPIECTVTVELDRTGTVAQVTGSSVVASHDVVVDGLSRTTAETFARALAPLRDASPGPAASTVPATSRLVDLLDVDAADATCLAESWAARPGSTAVPLGQGRGGEPVVVDLASDGPHALIAGTTGAGKSELLQSLIAGLAARNRPDELVFLLIDYKGGAAFRECAALPHAVGLVTDLAGPLTRRVLQSLEAELRRREQVLADAGCSDFRYVARLVGSPLSGSAPGLPRLVIAVDEFAALAEELPDFMTGLVSIAQRGRSLGLNLVLATQRPGRAVSADIRANTSLRIALRVTDPAESVDVIDARDAAMIPPTAVGRACLRRGNEAVIPLQVARVSGGTRSATRELVRPAPFPDRGTPSSTGPADDGPSDLGAIVDAARRAAALLGIPAPARPWLPPLPDYIALEDLRGCDDPAAGVAVGLQDFPAEQRQAPFIFSADDHWLVVGGAGSGRSSAVRTLAAALALRHPSTALHLHVIDPSGALAGLRLLPQVGTIVGRHEASAAARLLDRLVEELERRQRHGDADRPAVVLVVDGWESAQPMFEEVDDGRPLRQLERLAREGAAAGMVVVLTGDRPVLTSRTGSGIRRRVVLAMSDHADYGIAGVPRDRVPPPEPGRAVVTPDWGEVQLATLGRDRRGQGARLGEIATDCLARERAADKLGRPTPLRIRALPGFVQLDDIVSDAKEVATGTSWALLGVGGDEALPVGIDLHADGPAAIVAGPPGSGRSTALAVVAGWALQQGRPVALIASRRSPLNGMYDGAEHLVHLGVDDADALDRALARHPDLLVLVDDAEQLLDRSVEPALSRLADGDGPRQASLVLAGSAQDLATAFRGVAVAARRGRTGVLLGPLSPVDGDLLGTRVGRTHETVPGRGLLVVRGRAVSLQVAAVDLAAYSRG